VSFPNCAVDRIVPNKASGAATLNVTTEDYFQLAIDKSALIADIPSIAGIDVVDDLQAVLMQKFFTLNGAHAAVAYWGHLKGYETIDQAMQDQNIRALMLGFMEEVGTVLTELYPAISKDAQAAFAEKTLRRFCNPHLRDEPKRVGREPIRKLGGTDRLVRPAVHLLAMQQHPAHTLSAIVGGLLYRESGDTQSLEIGQKIAQDGIEESFVALTGLAQHHPLTRYIGASYRTMELAA
jgi:mannitol-1-phosphate 5-dehydrogenase